MGKTEQERTPKRKGTLAALFRRKGKSQPAESVTVAEQPKAAGVTESNNPDSNDNDTNHTQEHETWVLEQEKQRQELLEQRGEAARNAFMSAGQLNAALWGIAQHYNYSCANALIIRWQRPTATRVKSRSAWKAEGRSITKSAGIKVLERETYQKSDGSAGYGYVVSVRYDISQTDKKQESVVVEKLSVPQLFECLLVNTALTYVEKKGTEGIIVDVTQNTVTGYEINCTPLNFLRVVTKIIQAQHPFYAPHECEAAAWVVCLHEGVVVNFPPNEDGYVDGHPDLRELIAAGLFLDEEEQIALLSKIGDAGKHIIRTIHKKSK